jgi:hypothetical protein
VVRDRFLAFSVHVLRIRFCVQCNGLVVDQTKCIFRDQLDKDQVFNNYEKKLK